MDEIKLQQKYYSETAAKYDEMHVNVRDEHAFSLSFLVSVLDYLEVRSILDVGSGTGRAVFYLKQNRPDISVIGVEPVKELREVAYKKGLSDSEIIAGDATRLSYGDNEFDLVCAFGVLHHVKNPEAAISEMLRVANKAVFISDANNFGQGTFSVRLLKQLIDFLGLWKIANLVKTKGKGYMISEGDGLAYSYSVFSNYKQIRRRCKSVHVLNTMDGQINPYRSAAHVALLGIKGSKKTQGPAVQKKP